MTLAIDRRSWPRVLAGTLVFLGLTLGGASTASAQEQADGGAVRPGWGLRAGFGIDPDQLVVGGQLGLNRLFKVTRLVVSGDLGFLDNVVTVAFNGDLLLNITIPESSLAFYAGGGPTLALLDPEGAGSSWEVGLSLVGGMRLPTNTSQDFNLEARFGIGEIPTFRLLLGIFW